MRTIAAAVAAPAQAVGSHAIFNPNGPWYAIPAPGDQLPTRNADGPLPVG